MLLLRRAFNCTGLLKYINFNFSKAPRPQDVPTHDSVFRPFSINHLHDNPGAKVKKVLVGRGPSSGLGKTAGRGAKGQKKRGRVHPRFEGGQTAITKRLPKYGKTNRGRAFQYYHYVNIYAIEYFIKRGILNPQQPITIRELVACGLVKKPKFGVKLLAKGADKIKYPLKIQVTDASKPAIQAIQKAGGSVSLVYRTPLKLKQHMYPHKYPLPLEDPITPAYKVRKLLRKSEDRGIQIKFPQPKWLIDERLKQKESPTEKKTTFVYPVPIVENSGKIRKRKPQIYKKFNYGLS